MTTRDDLIRIIARGTADVADGSDAPLDIAEDAAGRMYDWLAVEDARLRQENAELRQRAAFAVPPKMTETTERRVRVGGRWKTVGGLVVDIVDMDIDMESAMLTPFKVETDDGRSWYVGVDGRNEDSELLSLDECIDEIAVPPKTPSEIIKEQMDNSGGISREHVVRGIEAMKAAARAAGDDGVRPATLAFNGIAITVIGRDESKNREAWDLLRRIGEMIGQADDGSPRWLGAAATVVTGATSTPRRRATANSPTPSARSWKSASTNSNTRPPR